MTTYNKTLKLRHQEKKIQFSCSVMSNSATAWTAAHHASPSITSLSIPELAPTHVHRVGDAILPSHPVTPFSSCLQSFLASRSFQMSVLCIGWSKYWNFSFSISPSSEYSGLISFRMDWLDLLAVQGTLKSLFQHHSSKAWILWHFAFYVVWFSHLYMTTGKAITLTLQTFVDKVMSLLFNMLSRLVIAFLPRSKRLLISWLQSPSAMILEPKKTVSHFFHCFPIYLP